MNAHNERSHVKFSYKEHRPAAVADPRVQTIVAIEKSDLQRMIDDAISKANRRPPHVTQVQAAEILRVSQATVSRMVKAGTLRLNKCGMIPMSQIDEVLN